MASFGYILIFLKNIKINVLYNINTKYCLFFFFHIYFITIFIYRWIMNVITLTFTNIKCSCIKLKNSHINNYWNC